MKDYLSYLIANIKNGQLARHSFIYNSNKKNICKTFLNVLWGAGFIDGYSENISLQQLKVFLKYHEKIPVICSFKIISKPSRRTYYSADKIQNINTTKSFIVFSTVDLIYYLFWIVLVSL